LGSYYPSAGTADVVPFSVTLACVGGSGNSTLPESSVALSAGSGSYSDREMQQGNTRLAYQVFMNAGLSTVWGDGSGATSVMSSPGGTSSQEIIGYGVISPGQWVQPGIYSDTLTVTVSY
jgi:spore coat protein U-like protein